MLFYCFRETPLNKQCVKWKCGYSSDTAGLLFLQFRQKDEEIQTLKTVLISRKYLFLWKFWRQRMFRFQIIVPVSQKSR